MYYIVNAVVHVDVPEHLFVGCLYFACTSLNGSLALPNALPIQTVIVFGVGEFVH